MRQVLTSLLQVLFPSTCAACGRVLAAGERQICMHCLSELDETGLAEESDNAVERKLAGRIHLQAAMSLYRFHHDSTVQRVVHAMKYHGNGRLCLMMGRQLGLALAGSGRFDDTDLLVPVPLHWRRRLARGYNQSELICRGIAEVFPRPIESAAVVRQRYTRKQSRQSGLRRADNVAGAFSVRHPERLAGHHVLLVDDVLTTGATLCACAEPMLVVDGLRLSVATLTIAG